jgi:NAD(P)-dependent dehydrogenase (short-subunit alcohol dehydrogenase family)
MKIKDAAILVTGANRGLGRALVEDALRRGARRVYAGTRAPFAHADARVTPISLDVTNGTQIQEAVEKVESLDILINNAAVAILDDLSDRAVIERHLAVNLFGTHAVTQAFLPFLARSRGALVNVLSEGALAPFPLVAAYGLSKAAAFSMTLSLRSILAARGVSVHAALPGPIDTDMSRGADIPKASPDAVARGILDGVETGEEEIFPDPISGALAEGWRSGAGKALERRYAAWFADITKS